MKKRLIALLLAVVMALGMIPFAPVAHAAATVEEALGEIGIYNGGVALDYLRVGGKVKTQDYAYYLFTDHNGEEKKIPAYCVNPTNYGVQWVVDPGQSVKYIANERGKDPKIMGIVANGYPTRSLYELKLNSIEEAYYATKTALWCYLLSGWNIGSLSVNPACSDQEAAKRVLAAAKDIYTRGMTWTSITTPEVTCTPDRDLAYDVEIDGKPYKQQIFTVTSKTWICNYAVKVALAMPDDAPEGTRIVDLDDNDISVVKTGEWENGGFNGMFKVIYPADSITGKHGSVQLALSLDIYNYAIYYAVCAESPDPKYGELQHYMAATDPTSPIQLNALSNYGDDTTPDDEPVRPVDPVPDEPEEPATGTLKIVKLETGTETPLAGAAFEVKGPHGDTVGSFATNENGEIEFPNAEVGSYTVTELSPPSNHLLCDKPTQTITVPEGGTGTLTFYNDPYGNLRVEKYSNTGEGLEGVTVEIKNIVTGETQSAQTGPGGAAMFEELKPGAYEVRETAGIKGWQADTETLKTVTVVTGETSTVTFTNKELPGLRVLKYDRVTGEILDGVKFRIWKDGDLLGDYVTNALGEIVITDAEPGTYLVQELESDDEHITEITPQQVELHAGDGIKELYFFNSVKPGMHLTKVDSADPSKGIPNAVFEIKSVDGKYGPEQMTTGADGSIDLSKLDPGAYVVTELSCPGYVIDDAQRIIQLDGDEDVEFVFTNSKNPDLHLIKVSADGTTLAGVSFRLAKIEDGSHYLDRVTDATGEILWEGLEPGVYSLKETATLDDHVLNAREYHVELFPGKTGTVVVENDKRPSLTIHKRDADTGEAVAGAVFLVKSADGHSIQEVKTGAGGSASVANLLPGVYEVSEKSVPAPYLLDADSQMVTLYPNRDRDVYFENHKAPNLTVLKIDSVTGNPIKGAKFSVWYSSNHTSTGEMNDLGCFYTDESGQFTVESTRDGWYKITEVEPAEGYALKEPSTQELYLKAGESETVTFENTPLSAMVVWKFDTVTGLPVEGATFQVRYLGGTSGTGGTVIGTYRTSANGSFTVTGLKAGTYIVEELASDEHHVVDTSPQTVYISGEEQDVVQVYFGNSPKGSLLIKKIDAVTHEPLSDVEFLVTDSYGAFIGNANGIYTTDSAGTILIEGLTPGTTLVVKETRGRDGYLLDDTPQTITVRAGQTMTLEFRDQPKGGLIVQKRDSVTGDALAGVQFKITYSDGSNVDTDNGLTSSNGIYQTDENGQITLNGVSGTIVVTETRTIPGYRIDPNSQTQTVVVNPGDTQTLTFYNEPTGGLFIKKMDAVTHEPLAGVTFKVTTTDGAVVGTSNGEFRTDETGYISIPDLEPGSYVVREVKARDGYLLDDTAKTIEIKDHRTYTLEFFNQPLGGLIVQKLDSVTKEPLEGVQFKITYADGRVVDAEGGKLSSNGLYWTNENGQIVLGDVTGTLVVTEVQTIPGYVIHEETRSQTVVVNPDDTQTLYFYNDPVGGVEIIKVNAADKTERIPNVTFEIRAMNDALVDVVTTDDSGRAFSALDEGAYYAVEIETAKGYKLDNTPRYFEVEDGRSTVLTIENQPFSGIMLHKIDAFTKDGVYGAVFLLYDDGHTPLDQYTTDQNGWIYIDDLAEGKYYLKEMEAEGYIVDEELKTVYIKDDSTVELEWENTPFTGSIQITKTSADDNPVNGKPAGTPLEGTVFEIYDLDNNLVDTVTTDQNGIATTKDLPLGRYVIRETKATDLYVLNDTPVEVEIETAGQTVRVSVANKSRNVNVSITKTGYEEVMPGQSVRYELMDIGNNSNVALDSFYWRDVLPTEAVVLDKIVTGTYSDSLTYSVVYQTNKSNGSYYTLTDNLSTDETYTLEAGPAALKLASDEYVTEFMFVFGTVPVGFHQVEKAQVYCIAKAGLTGGSQFTNVADVGGEIDGEWQRATSRWVTNVYAADTPSTSTPSTNTPSTTLPKTGY